MKKTFYLLTLILLSSFYGWSQNKQPDPDPIDQAFFSPELVMQNQKFINLKTDQQKKIVIEMKQAQSEFMDLNWEMKKMREEFISVIATPKVDENKAIDGLNKILEVENKIKKRQVILMIRIKNVLSEDQQKKLIELKK